MILNFNIGDVDVIALKTMVGMKWSLDQHSPVTTDKLLMHRVERVANSFAPYN